MNKQPKTLLYGAYLKDLGIFGSSMYSNGFQGHIKLIFMVGISKHIPQKEENII